MIMGKKKEIKEYGTLYQGTAFMLIFFYTTGSVVDSFVLKNNLSRLTFEQGAKSFMWL